MRNTLWRVERFDDDWFNAALLDFTFKNQVQDYEKFLSHPYWIEKYDLETPPSPESNNAQTTYISEIVEVLKELGGIGHLKEICQIIEERDLLTSVKTNPNWKRNVSAELQKNCKTSKSYIDGNPNLFYHVNEKRDGIWGLVEAETKNKNNYSKTKFLSEVYMDNLVLDRINFMLETKKNIILQGAPGVGKTYAAKRIAYQFMGEKNEERICFVQFHQSYCYEDFISGYKPNDTGFELRTGPFYNFCSKAKSNSDKPHFFIIDEINRGNISKIFGELLMLIEADKRNEEIMLSDGTKFSVPDNLYIIGMMNTADRSLAMIDYALRRRFSFIKFEPAFENKQFRSELNEINNASLNKLIDVIVKLNEDIKNDSSLGEGFRIGHSYFCFDTEKVSNVELYLKNVVEYDIIPLLEEYWFDNSDKVDEWSRKLIEAVKSDGDL